MLLVCISLVTTLQRILYAEKTLISDEAIGGLMASKVLEGEFPIYYWGQTYFGSLYSYIAAPSMWLFGEASIVAFRLPLLLLIAVITIALYRFAETKWGRVIAVCSVLFLLFPGLHVAKFMRATAHVRLLLIIIIFMMLFSDWPTKGNAKRAALLGVLFGLSLWISPTFAALAFIGMLVWVLGSEEWKRVHTSLASLHAVLPVMIWGLIVCVILFFCATVLPRGTSSILLQLEHTTFTVGIVVIFAIVLRSRHQWKSMCFFSGGLLLGNAPQWMSALLLDQIAINKIPVSVPTLRFPKFMLSDILPALWGFAPLPPETLHLYWFFYIFICLCGLICVITFRKEIWSVCIGRPTNRHMLAMPMIMLLFAMSVCGLYLHGGGSISQVRTILDARLASALIIGMGSMWLVQRLRKKAVVLVTLFLCGIAVSTSLVNMRRLPIANENYHPNTLASLETFFREHGVEGGYSYYTIAYRINFLTHERIIIAPTVKEVKKRRPEYREHVDSLARYAYIVRRREVSIDESSRSSTDLSSALRSYWNVAREGTSFDQLLSKIGRSAVLNRQRFGSWDVWLLSGPQLQ